MGILEKNKENDNHDVPFYNRCFSYIRKSCVNTTETVLGTPNGLPYYFQDKVQFLGLDFKAYLNLASAYFFCHHLPLSCFGKRMAPVSLVTFSCIQAIRSARSALLYCTRAWEIWPLLREVLLSPLEGIPPALVSVILVHRHHLVLLDRELLKVSGMSESVWFFAQGSATISQIDVSRI